MTLIRPFAGVRPQAAHTSAVIAPPYDVLNAEEARQRAAGKAWSFLHISRPEIDLPPDTDPYAAAVYAKGAENFQHLRQQQILSQDAQPCYYLYELVMGNHHQTGLVAVASVADYDSNRIRKHEFTRPDKEDDRVRQIDTLNAQTGPVLLAYRQNAALQAIIDTVTAQPPLVDVCADDGIQHRLWVVEAAAQIDRITALVDAMPALYIADGHHRSAAASRVASQRRANNPRHTGDEAYNYFLTVMFPDDQMQILDYNRVVKDLNGLSKSALLDALRDTFTITPCVGLAQPRVRGEFGLYVAGHWYYLQIQADKIPTGDPVAALDVSLLSDHLLGPVLGITDLRRDKRIDFVGGIRGLEALQARVDSGEMAAAFALYPTSLQELMAVADAGRVMPPKSTWFEPKLADGLVSHLL